MFNLVQCGDITLYFSWDRIYIRQTGNTQTYELFQVFKKQYCQGCFNYNRNVRQDKQKVYFIHEQRQLKIIDVLANPRQMIDARTHLDNVDTFTIVGNRLFTLIEQGVVCRHSLSTGRLLKRRNLAIPGEEKWYTTIETFGEQILVCALDKSYFKKSSNRIYLLDATTLSVLDTYTVESVSTKLKKSKCYPNPMHIVKPLRVKGFPVILVANLFFSLQLFSTNKGRLHFLDSKKIHSDALHGFLEVPNDETRVILFDGWETVQYISVWQDDLSTIQKITPPIRPIILK